MITTLQMPSPVGLLTLIADDEALVGLRMEAQAPSAKLAAAAPKPSPILKAAQKQLGEYFAGKRTSFELPLALEGTDFQRTVWAALRQIPFGETRSYGELARAIGQPKASRAVGAANRVNPIGIIVPCHRVIGADGSLTGYAGGKANKRWLLDWEHGPALL